MYKQSGLEHAFKNCNMKIENTFYNIFNRGWSLQPVLTPVFLFYRESLRILPKLIISSLKQRLTIQPNNLLNIQSCSDLRVSTGTAYLYSMFSNGAMQGAFLG